MTEFPSSPCFILSIFPPRISTNLVTLACAERERSFPCGEENARKMRVKERKLLFLHFPVSVVTRIYSVHKKFSSQIISFFGSKTKAVRVSRRWVWDRRLEESSDWHVPWCPGPPRTPVRHPWHSGALKSCTLACGMYSANWRRNRMRKDESKIEDRRENKFLFV